MSTNDERAHRARSALEFYVHWQQNAASDGVCTDLTDLVTDLLHLCDREKGCDFDAILALARKHHETEIWEETK